MRDIKDISRDNQIALTTIQVAIEFFENFVECECSHEIEIVDDCVDKLLELAAFYIPGEEEYEEFNEDGVNNTVNKNAVSRILLRYYMNNRNI